ncbi:hypothetical protein, partial [Ligilactobacillus ruminis]|uniref:hypothetical protein n=2 Tax=Ligilactobacillus ruminis TaxID=1623 RepID=UPI001F3E3C90
SPETTDGGCGLREADSQLTCSFTKEGLEMLMDNTLELLGITDSNINITRFSAESVNGEKRNVIEARLTYNVNRCPYCESEKVVRNGSKILHTRQERFEMKLYKQRYL